jgi:hypothetical protein
MGDIIRRGGQIVRAHNGLITRNPNCCCGSDCCGGTLGTDYPTLYLHLTNVSDCGCIDGQCIELTWDGVNQIWTGTGGGPAGGDCSADEADWTFTCENNPNGALGSCFDFKLFMAGAGVTCFMINDGYPSDCFCGDDVDDPWWEYDFSVSGISCCDSFSGSGTFTARVDTVPC